MSVAPTLRNLRIVHKKRQSGKSKVPAKQCGSWPKSVLKLKEHQRATFFSPSENRCLLASNLKLEEREFVVDSGASMHMISKKDLNDAALKPAIMKCGTTMFQWTSEVWRLIGTQQQQQQQQQQHHNNHNNNPSGGRPPCRGGGA